MRAVLLLAFAATLASATQITWTGLANDHQWTNRINWNPPQVPAENDDVTINKGVVLCTKNTGVNSLSMGALVSTSANLTLFEQFIVGNGGLQVQENGNLIINTGLSTVFGQVTIGGSLTFVDGALSGEWTVTPRALADLGNQNAKALVAGSVFNAQGQTTLGGVLVLNASSTFTLSQATTVSQNLILQSLDKSGALFDASAAAFTFSGQQLTVEAPVKFGPFTLTSGNVRILDALTFNDAIKIGQGSTVAAYGAGTLTATNGITGAGTLTVATAGTSTLGGVDMTGAVNFFGGTCVLQGSSSMADLTIKGGQAVSVGTVSTTQLNLLSGSIAGTSSVNAQTVTINTKGFVLSSKVVASKTVSIKLATLDFGQNGGLVIKSGATATVSGKATFAGPPFTPGVTNNGNIQCTSSLHTENINIVGTGSVSVSGKLAVDTATLNQTAVSLSASGELHGMNTYINVGKVSGTGPVQAALGDYELTCGPACTSVVTPNMKTPPAGNFSFTL